MTKIVREEACTLRVIYISHSRPGYSKSRIESSKEKRKIKEKREEKKHEI
jgi:hypothetical protein